MANAQKGKGAIEVFGERNRFGCLCELVSEGKKHCPIQR